MILVDRVSCLVWSNHQHSWKTLFLFIAIFAHYRWNAITMYCRFFSFLFTLVILTVAGSEGFWCGMKKYIIWVIPRKSFVSAWLIRVRISLLCGTIFYLSFVLVNKGTKILKGMIFFVIHKLRHQNFCYAFVLHVISANTVYCFSTILEKENLKTISSVRGCPELCVQIVFSFSVVNLFRMSVKHQ